MLLPLAALPMVLLLVRGGARAALAVRGRDEATGPGASVGAPGATALAASFMHRRAGAPLPVSRGDVPTRTRTAIGAAALAFSHVSLPSHP